MHNEAPPAPTSPTKIAFAAWHTPIENDRLLLGRLNFDLGSPLVFFPEGKTLSLAPEAPPRRHVLEATFISIEREAVVRVTCDEVIAFRVLDENALLDLWHASASTPRPARTTFRATGHPWTEESFLAFLGAGNRTRFSYFIATDYECLEIVCDADPVVEIMGPAITEHSSQSA